MKNKIIDVPFESSPILRAIFEILESHEENGVTIIDKAEIKEIYILNKDTLILDSQLGENYEDN